MKDINVLKKAIMIDLIYNRSNYGFNDSIYALIIWKSINYNECI